MFNFFKKGSKSSYMATQLPIATDLHSHILPGIDDGAPDIPTAIELVKGLVALGIRKSVATPHVISDMYRNTPQTIHDALGKLTAACREHKINIELSAAAEYMLDDYVLKMVRGGEPLLTLHENIVLTEQSYATRTANLNEISFELVTSGYKPIMAHPERYGYYHDDYDNYTSLKDMGFLLQVNLLSLTGYYGKPVAKAARFIIEKGLADFVATDLHHHRHLSLLQNPANLQLFHDLLSSQRFNQLLQQ